MVLATSSAVSSRSSSRSSASSASSSSSSEPSSATGTERARLAVVLGATALLLFFILLSSSAEAQAPRPPPSLALYADNASVVQNVAIQSYGNITFRLSPDDPDQLNGSFNYSIYRNQTANATCNAVTTPGTACGWERFNFTPQAAPANNAYVPIPERPGWVKARASGQNLLMWVVTDGTFSCRLNAGLETNFCAYNMTAWKGTNESIPSCLIAGVYTSYQAVLVGKVGEWGQCGDAIPQPPSGTAGIVTSFTTASVRHSLSPQDTGGGNYSLSAYAINSDGSIFEFHNRSNSTPVNGYRQFNYSRPDAPMEAITFRTWFADPFNFQRSNLSCSFTLQMRLNGSGASCGNVTEFGALGTFASGGILFPFVNDAPNLAATYGLTSLTWGPFLGVMMTLIFVGLAWLLTSSAMGAFAGGLVGFVGSTIFGLFPSWILIVVFAAGLGAFLLTGRGARGEA